MTGSSHQRIWVVMTLAVLIDCGSAAAATDRVPLEVRLGARAGLDDESIEALFMTTFRTAAQEDIA